MLKWCYKMNEFKKKLNSYSLSYKKTLIAIHDYKFLYITDDGICLPTMDVAMNLHKDDPELSESAYAIFRIMHQLTDKGQDIDIISYMSLMQESHAIAQGPKIFHLTTDTCEALENVELNFLCSDYRQPFETVVIEFSDDYATNRMVKNDYTFQEYMKDSINKFSDNEFFASHDPLRELECYKTGGTGNHIPAYAIITLKGKVVCFTIQMKELYDDNNTKDGYVLVHWMNLEDGKTLEECYVKGQSNSLITLGLEYKDNHGKLSLGDSEKSSVNDVESKLIHKVLRTCANLCMLSVRYGADEIDDPVRTNMIRKLAKAPEKYRKNNEIEILTRPQYFKLDQKIKLFDKQTVYLKESNQGQGFVRPHHRSGYWRWQKHGPNFTLKKFIYIKPVFVNFKYFNGGMSETSVDFVE